jgi:hypothetical protein
LVAGFLFGENDLGLQKIELRCARRTSHRGRQRVEEFELFLEEEPSDIAVHKPLVHAGRSHIAVGVEVVFHPADEGAGKGAAQVLGLNLGTVASTCQQQHHADAECEMTSVHGIPPFDMLHTVHFASSVFLLALQTHANPQGTSPPFSPTSFGLIVMRAT